MFSLVNIPPLLQAYMLLFAAAAYWVALGIERGARRAFPAGEPPEKGGLTGPTSAAGRRGGRAGDNFFKQD
jgi:hypothetical protein